MEEQFLSRISNVDDFLSYHGTGNAKSKLKYSSPKTTLAFKDAQTVKETVNLPDLNICELSSPELERLIVGQTINFNQTTTLGMSKVVTNSISDLCSITDLASPDLENFFSNFNDKEMLSINGSKESSVGKQNEAYAHTFSIGKIQDKNGNDIRTEDGDLENLKEKKTLCFGNTLYLQGCVNEKETFIRTKHAKNNDLGVISSQENNMGYEYSKILQKCHNIKKKKGKERHDLPYKIKMNSDGSYLREFGFSIEEKNRGTIPVDSLDKISSGRKKQKLYTYKNINNPYSNDHDTHQYNVDSIPSNHCPVANEEQVTPSNSNLFESYGSSSSYNRNPYGNDLLSIFNGQSYSQDNLNIQLNKSFQSDENLSESSCQEHADLLCNPQLLPINTDLLCNPQVFPINMHFQEIAKRERKKQKNRVAASKCRKKKLEREATLEVRLKELKTRNMKLINITNILKQQLNDLKKNLMEHIVFGCMMKPYP